MAKTIKAERATILLGDIPIEVYQLPDGSYKLSGRNVTDAVSEANNTLIRYYGVKSLKDLNEPDVDLVFLGKDGSPFIPVSIKCALKYWGSRGVLGNSKAQDLLRNLEENPEVLGVSKGDVPVFIGNKKASVSRPEAIIRDRLAKCLNGEIEVLCLDGRIDVLTSSELIEVKSAKGWKGAIGQALVYGASYPSHQKRIHLFGAVHSSVRERIQAHCDRLDIVLTWE
mgnify:FL=1